MAETKPIPVRLDGEIISRLDTAAKRLGTKRAGLIRFLTQSFLDHYDEKGGVISLPHNWEEILRSQDGRTYGQLPATTPMRKSVAKAKRAHLRDVDSVSLDVFGEMGAGEPLAATDQPLGVVRVRRGRFAPDAFAARVNGFSMIEVGVDDGDLVALRWAEHQEANPGDIVCVHIFGDGSVLKQLVEQDGHRWLISRNPKFPDICLDCEGEPKGCIQAVMVGKI